MMLLTPMIPSLGAFVMAGCYRWDAVRTDITGVMTNKMATDAIRGAGRPEATHYIEVMVDQMAQELGIDRLELRRQQLHPEGGLPVRDGRRAWSTTRATTTGTLARLLEHFDPERSAATTPDGKLRGVGFSTWTEICGLAPSRATGPARLRRPGGADGVGARARARHRRGDRLHRHVAARPGAGDDASRRSSPTSSASTRRPSTSCTATRRRARGASTPTARARWPSAARRSPARPTRWSTRSRAIVAHKLEAAPEDIELRDGTFSVKGSPGPGHDARRGRRPRLHPRGQPARRTWRPGLEETSFYDPENFVFPFGAHAAVVEVDPETGKVDLVRYLAVDDCGPAINPMLIDGQVHGGITHARRPGAVRAGRLRRERPARDGLVRLLRAARAPRRCRASRPTARRRPSPVNSLGVKGVGEAGTIAASAAVTNAVIDALRPRGVDFINMPLTPDAGVGGAPGEGRCAGMIPAEFDYVAPESLDAALAALREGGEDAKVLAGGHSLVPLMKLRLAAPTLLVDLRRVPGLTGHPARERHGRVGAMTVAPRRRGTAPELGLAARWRRRRSPTSRSATAARSAARSPTATRPPTCRRCCSRSRAPWSSRGRGRRARDRGRRPVPGLPHDGGGGRRDRHRGPAPGRRRLGRRLREVQPARRGLGDGRGLRRGAQGRRTAPARTSASG